MTVVLREMILRLSPSIALRISSKGIKVTRTDAKMCTQKTRTDANNKFSVHLKFFSVTHKIHA